MRIPLPPTSNTGLENIIATCVRDLNRYFDFNTEGACFKGKLFESYYSQFAWFEGDLQSTEAILNIGCSHGRETFALMWFFEATQAIGIDIRSRTNFDLRTNTVLSLKTLAKQLRSFLALPLGSGWSREYIQEFREWWENQVPHSISESVTKNIIPEFISGDASDRTAIPKPDDHFDLVYCCNVLDELINEGKDCDSVIQNMAAVVKPEIGRVVVVGATKRDSTQHKHSKYFVSLDELGPRFQAAGLKLLKVEKTPRLGHLDWPLTEPQGYIFRKQ